MKIIKSTSTLRKQEKRIWNLLQQVTKSLLLKAHPESGGSAHLAGSWGNDEAKVIVQRFYDRQVTLFNIMKKKYDLAFMVEFPEHNMSKAYVAEHGQIEGELV